MPNDEQIKKIYDEVKQLYPTLDAVANTLADEKSHIDWFPRDKLWRLVIDGANQTSNDSMVFDNPRPGSHGEHGYLLAMIRSFILMERTLALPLSLSLLESLHNMTMENVYFYDHKGMRTHRNRFNFRCSDANKNDTGYQFAMVKSNCSERGLEEAIKNDSDIFKIGIEFTLFGYTFKRQANMDDPNLPSQIVHRNNMRWNNVFAMKYIRLDATIAPGFFEKKTQKSIDDYYQEIKLIPDNLTLENQSSILRAIAKCIHRGEVQHSFADGNIRLCVFLQMNKLLLQNGFPPSILEMPEVVGFFSIDEIALAIVKGMRTVLLRANYSKYNKFIDIPELMTHFESRVQATPIVSKNIDSRMIKSLDEIYKRINDNTIDPISMDDGYPEYRAVLIHAFNQNNLALLRRCLRLKFDLDFRDNNQFQLVHHAIISGNIKFMELLLWSGAKPGAINLTFAMLRKEAEDKNRIDALFSLFDKYKIGKLPNSIPNVPCLHLAVFFGRKDAIEPLLIHGANLVEKVMGITALELAEAMGYPEIAALLWKKLKTSAYYWDLFAARTMIHDFWKTPPKIIDIYYDEQGEYSDENDACIRELVSDFQIVNKPYMAARKQQTVTEVGCNGEAIEFLIEPPGSTLELNINPEGNFRIEHIFTDGGPYPRESKQVVFLNCIAHSAIRKLQESGCVAIDTIPFITGVTSEWHTPRLSYRSFPEVKSANTATKPRSQIDIVYLNNSEQKVYITFKKLHPRDKATFERILSKLIIKNPESDLPAPRNFISDIERRPDKKLNRFFNPKAIQQKITSNQQGLLKLLQRAKNRI